MLEFIRKLFRRRTPVQATANTEIKSAKTAQRRAVGSLHESEDHFGKLVAGVRDYAVFLLDPQGTILTWNAGAERIKGYRAEQIIGRHFSCFYPTEAVSMGWPTYELSVAATTGRFEDEGWRVRQDGTRFWASVVITALWDDAGKVRGYLKITRDRTDQKLAEEKLRLSEERFRLMVESVKDYAIFMLDPEGRIVTWNAGAERLKGYKAGEIIGQHFSRFYPQEVIESGWPEEELRRAAAEGRIEDEGWRIRKDGTRFWASVVISASRDNFGTLRGFTKVTRDLTERRQAEESTRRLIQEEAARKAAEEAAQEIERQREQLRVTLASIGDAVIATDSKGLITFLNPIAAELTGWKSHEAVGQPLERVFHIINEETLQPVENPVSQVFREGRIIELANHTALITHDGRQIPITDTASPIRSKEEAIGGAVLVFRDVTETRRAMETRVRLAAIVESSDDAIIGQTLDGRIVTWNRGAERLYGYTAEEILGRSLGLLVPPDHPDELPSILERLKRGEVIEHFETQRVRKDGSRVHVSLTVSPIRDTEGKIIGASKIARDITSRKEEDRRKDEFLALLAHELRNPLAPLRNSLQVMQLAGNDLKTVEHARTVMERQLQHLVRLVDDLLDISRISQGKLRLRKKQITLTTIVNHAIEVCEALVKQRGDELTVSLPEEPVYVEADETRLVQSLCNLLSNAAKYSEQGSRIWLTAHREGNEAVISVKDTGIGIPSHMLTRVFDMFTQVDQTLEKSQGGLGIGLGIVKRLIEMHGGTVEARSEGTGLGSEFIIRLPTIQLAAPEQQNKSSLEQPHPIARHRVLVVDDNVDAADSLAMMLEVLGHETQTAHDGLQGIETAAAFRPDVILLDIGMPRLNGYDTCHRIREQPWGKDVVIVALTGWGQDEDRRRSKEAGFDRHLVKPVEPIAFEQLLADLQSPT